MKAKRPDPNDILRQRGPAGLRAAFDKAERTKANGTSGQAAVIIREAATYAMKPINSLWPHWLARGKLHILAGAPGTAKMTVGIEMAAHRVARWTLAR